VTEPVGARTARERAFVQLDDAVSTSLEDSIIEGGSRYDVGRAQQVA
jgi:hypothetical protein